MWVIEELPRSRERFDAVSAARWALIVVIVLGTLIVWWTTPRTSSVEQLSLDLQDGKVTWIDTDCRPEGGDALVGLTVVSRPDFVDDHIGRPNAGRDVCWRTTLGQTYAADADELNRDVVREAKSLFGGAPELDALTPALKQSAADLAPGDGPQVVEEFGDGTGPLRNWAIGITGVCVVGLIIVMIAWQQPRRGTRWGWFWIMITASGLGAIVYLIFEAPWNRKAIAMPQPKAHQTKVPRPDGTTRDRFSGRQTFVLAIVVSFVLAAVFGLFGWFDGDVGQGVGNPEVRWTVVEPYGEVGLLSPYSR